MTTSRVQQRDQQSRGGGIAQRKCMHVMQRDGVFSPQKNKNQPLTTQPRHAAPQHLQRHPPMTSLVQLCLLPLQSRHSLKEPKQSAPTTKQEQTEETTTSSNQRMMGLVNTATSPLRRARGQPDHKNKITLNRLEGWTLPMLSPYTAPIHQLHQAIHSCISWNNNDNDARALYGCQ